MKYKDFIKECGDKQVFKKLSIYVVTSWVIIQVLAVFYEPLGMPKSSIAICIILLLLGFPIYVFYIWKTSLIHLKLEGEELFDDSGHPVDFKKVTKKFNKMFFISFFILCVMVLFSSAFMIKNNFFNSKNKIAVTSNYTDKIAVLKFGNNTGDAQFDLIGKMTSDWIIHGLAENHAGQVISQELIDSYIPLLENSNLNITNEAILNRYLKPGKVISGNFYKRNNQLEFKGTMMDKTSDATISFESVSCNSNTPLDCIEELKQLILGYLVVSDNEVLNLEESPPKYEAYEALIEAKAVYNNPSKYLTLLNKATTIDADFFEAEILKVAHFYNELKYNAADSILKNIEIVSSKNWRQKNLILMYEALLNGENDKVFQFLNKEYDLTPQDLGTNSGTMTVALQYINKPENVDEIYKAISIQESELQNCIECAYRVYIKAQSEIALGNYNNALKLLEPAVTNSDYIRLKESLLTSLVYLKKDEEVRENLEDFKLKLSDSDFNRLLVVVANNYQLLDNEFYKEYYQQILNNDFLNVIQQSIAHLSFNNFNVAIKLLENEYSEIAHVIKAIGYSKLNDIELFNDEIERLIALRHEYDFGGIDYAIAQVYASTGKPEIAINHLKIAVSSGYQFEAHTYKNDPMLMPVFDHPEFENILNYWH